MSAALDHLLSAPDAFTLFGFERTFDVNAAELERRYEQLTRQARDLACSSPDKSERVLVKLTASHKTLSDPVARGELLLGLLGGKSDPATNDLPPDSGTQSWDRLLARTSNLFRQLGSADNAVVQRERRRQIRQSLNGLRDLARKRPGPSGR